MDLLPSTLVEPAFDPGPDGREKRGRVDNDDGA